MKWPFVQIDMDGLHEPVVLPWGPFATAGTAIIIGFLLLNGYAAWQHGAGYQVPARDFLALLIIMGFFGVTTYSFLGTLHESGDIILGALIAAFSAVITLYFRHGGDEK